jgi:AraC family transcriptional regulator of adaptative response/methylated-DNA-[protein]-cysteine methyltransferase
MSITASSAQDTDRWRAVLARDAGQDGRFVLAVSTTGIYCRPSCPARKPLREHVSFYDTPGDARVAGYRACLRCHPDQAATNAGVDLVKRATAILDQPGDEAPTLRTLGERLGVSPYYLQRTFKRVTGVSPRQYIAERRAAALRSGLRNGAAVTDAIYDAGYGSASRVYENASDVLGMTPRAYRNGAGGTSIRYTIVDTPLGKLLLAATERGLARVALADSATELESLLEREFHAALRTVDDAALRPTATAVLELIAGREPSAALPLDVRATAFQRQVWEALRAIPRGATRSYAQLAREIGRPGAARAVAGACASNPVAIVVPCHRVVRGNGDLGGYRWGLERKRRLLDAEQAGESDQR